MSWINHCVWVLASVVLLCSQKLQDSDAPWQGVSTDFIMGFATYKGWLPSNHRLWCTCTALYHNVSTGCVWWILGSGHTPCVQLCTVVLGACAAFCSLMLVRIIAYSKL